MYISIGEIFKTSWPFVIVMALLDDGTITKSEFDAKKRELLG